MTFTTPPPPPPPRPKPCLHFPSKFEWSPLWILVKFSAIPPFGFSVTTDPQGINNDRSLMCFTVIMQHANMAYHVQRAYKGPTIWLLRGGVVEVIWEKNILKSDFEHKKVLQGNTGHTIPLYVRHKHSMITRGLGGKNSYANPWNHPNYMWKILLLSAIALATPIFDSALSV